MNILTLLVHTENFLKIAIECPYFVRILTIIQKLLRHSWNGFIQEEITNLFSTKVSNTKQAGILSPFLKFPLFIERIQLILQNQTIMDISCHKLVQTLFNWLENIAKMDEKYADVVRLENYHYFWKIFSSRIEPIIYLKEDIEKSQQLYLESMEHYIEWHLRYECPQWITFETRLQEQLKISDSPNEVPFAQDLSKQDLRNLLKNYLSKTKLHNSIKNILLRVKKHLPKNYYLAKEIWERLTNVFINRYRRFEKLVQDCYISEKVLVTVGEIEHIFRSLPAPGTEMDGKQGPS